MDIDLIDPDEVFSMRPSGTTKAVMTAMPEDGPGQSVGGGQYIWSVGGGQCTWSAYGHFVVVSICSTCGHLVVVSA